MFTTVAYCTLADVKLAMDLQATTDDTWIATLITQSQDMIDREVGYPFQTDGTVGSPAARTYDGNNTDTILIDDCLSLSSVKQTTYNIGLGSGGYSISGFTTVDITADCLLYPLNRTPQFLMKRLSGLDFYQGTSNYAVTGVFGQASIPPQISRACVRIAIHLYKMRDASYSTVTTNNQYGNQTYMSEIPADVMEILRRYKKRLFL